ncbi:P-loop containing nucleoside triphosphate hydrolase protein [Kockovaella imperatae]|uniref:p-loop containing nucleoside triphosphate hydrolase protein n=1 Tax=Kockovaella imperatae TaxID=4999 RepID=A0A1Y1UC49_9TREE|nr:P-loop containing nucleoside triphosphate hydrolase protein [Kockovaella imperatae]ORX35107.1 P-loop containing nucleoside triphosphate hydrolase protein [Kockovaella imperatae]
MKLLQPILGKGPLSLDVAVVDQDIASSRWTSSCDHWRIRSLNSSDSDCRIRRAIIYSKTEHFRDSPRRLLVAVAGPPGCGKSTVVGPLCAMLNLELETSGASLEDGRRVRCATVSLDGWHYPRVTLDKMPDPTLAHWRRGAPFTYDRLSYLDFLKGLRSSGGSKIAYKTFNHATKDPEPGLVPIDETALIILIEGLYTAFDRPGWRECAEMMDRRVWIEVDPAVSRERVIRRNLAAGVSIDLLSAIDRVDASDMLNDQEVRNHRLAPTDVIVSVEI